MLPILSYEVAGILHPQPDPSLEETLRFSQFTGAAVVVRSDGCLVRLGFFQASLRKIDHRSSCQGAARLRGLVHTSNQHLDVQPPFEITLEVSLGFLNHKVW